MFAANYHSLLGYLIGKVALQCFIVDLGIKGTGEGRMPDATPVWLFSHGISWPVIKDRSRLSPAGNGINWLGISYVN